MANRDWETDEDRQINRLEAHRDFITWVINRLQAEGIRCERTRGNDSRGDILYYNTEDEPRVKKIVRQINAEYNKS
ncbi:MULTISPECIES: hypothetical protein [Nostocales]|uniref:hypothetical protein n=1 Tax=Nostocales TaxID=1161 RepID=UPI001686F42B|nr:MULTISPECIES: hypothetical protein [Nostocales]MBD2300827.1 hypothetical protein [Nostoc sp. FACHB-190]MBD2487328.1 hypothetical protein [Aulosira sp. FACHB-615]